MRYLTARDRQRSVDPHKWLWIGLVLLAGILSSCTTRYQLSNIATASSGSFSVELRSDKLKYQPWDNVRIEATVRYVGPQPSLTLQCGLPVAFGLRQLDGDISFGGPASRPFNCNSETMKRDERRVISYSAVGHGYSMSDPRAETFQRMFAGLPCCLQFPSGTWQVSVWLASVDEPAASVAISITIEVSSAVAV